MGESKREKTKKEHYVPRCYLERWKNSKGQVFAYDKKLKRGWKSNVYDIACERYFYDIDYKELSIQQKRLLTELGIEPKEDEQFIEHFFSDYVENLYSELLSSFLDIEITPWYEKNCCFFLEKRKLEFAICIAFQYIRTREKRARIIDMSNCLEQMLREINASDEVIDRYIIKKGEEKSIQGNMILDIDHIFDMALTFHELTWILGVNKTAVEFYTSDNPIGTIPHVKNNFISMSGIKSKGIEVFFPLSPKHILIMYDGKYHKSVTAYDRRYVPIDELELVEVYNKWSVYNCNRCVFSKDGNLSAIDEILKTNPELLDFPKAKLSWGGKEFFPK